MTPAPKVSVIIPIYNEAKSLETCLISLLKNEYPSFEIIFVDDGSTDGSSEVISRFSDPRVHLVRSANRSGPAEARNLGVQASEGEFLFFTDADCFVSKDWISQGMAAFLANAPEKVVGVEGNLYYLPKDTVFRHKMPINPFYDRPKAGLMNLPQRDFGCGNIAYKKSDLIAVGGFNGRRYISGREDSDLGWRISKRGIIVHHPSMEIIHKESYWNSRKLVTSALRYQNDVIFYKDHGFFFFKKGVVLHPRFFIWALCPFLVIGYFKFRSPRDYLFLLPFWGYLIGLRFVIWKEAIKQRVFVL